MKFNEVLEKLNDHKNLIQNNIELLKHLAKGPEKNVQEGEEFLKNIELLIKSLKMIFFSNRKINSEKRKVLEARSKIKIKIEKIMKYRRNKGVNLLLWILKDFKKDGVKKLISSLRKKIRHGAAKKNIKNKLPSTNSIKQTPSLTPNPADTKSQVNSMAQQPSRNSIFSSQEPSRNSIFSSFISKGTTMETEPPRQSSTSGKRVYSARKLNQSVYKPPLPIRPEILMRAVISAFVTSLPSEMCYKKKEVGQLPSRCPKGFFFDTTLESCVETCHQDYTYHLASCWTTCPTGTQDCGGFCGSSCTETSSWKAKKNYVPSHIPSSNNDVKCEKGLYKSCNLCFKIAKKLAY